MDTTQEIKHQEIEQDFLHYIGSDTPLILKGGTALLFCYGLDRFSEDLDFDAEHQGYSSLKTIHDFATSYGYTYSEKKNTPTVQRATIDYGGYKPLKIETSLRQRAVNPSRTTVINGIHVYTIEQLAIMKANAYLGRDKIRDLYDLSYIVTTAWDKLPDATQDQIREALANKGLGQFDYLLTTNNDPLINTDQLIDRFLAANDIAGLITDEFAPHQEAPQYACSRGDQNQSHL
ncbi:MAG: nucleotidyl transferase AbiEii/AbiGii toxin family protein [Actinomycetaceae bacterium]|nr:nucleotidyl transferase AbiEii/AbiGii toxin family protein [Actinomycetaceae bacterium]MDY6082520.1 nucleotidyl transferase AbiEii/AbiGii toxin family protein [Actinomycetaceae bacterium]